MNREALIQGKSIQTPEGENLGNIKEIKTATVKWGSDELDYDLLLISGLLEDKNKWLILPLEAFQHDDPVQETDPVTLNVEKNRLKNSPQFTNDNQPRFIDITLLDTIYVYYGFKKYCSNHTII